MMQYSIISFLKVRELETFRFDAEYFKPEYLEIDKIVASDSERFTTLEELRIRIDASAFYPPLEPFYGKGRLSFLRVIDTNNFINYAGALTIPEEILKEYRTLKTANKGDVIVTKGGSIARVGLIDRKSAVCRDLIIFRTSRLDEVNYTFIFIYFLTDIYKKMLIRSSSMTAQPHLTLTLVKDLPIFNPGLGFKRDIFNVYSKYKRLIDESDELYFEAEKILLSEIGLLDWKPKRELSFVKNFSDTKSADRIDAEYFQPIYDEIIYTIKSYRKRWDKLGNLFQQNKRKFKIIADKMYEYVEISCVSISDGVIKPLIVYGNQLPPNAKVKLLKEDIIVSKVRPYRGAVGIVDSDNYVGSSAFTVLQPSGRINKETLVTLLRTKPYLQLSLKFNTGTSYPTITDNDILNLEIPLIPNDIQESVKKKIQKANENRACAKSLLDIAKRGVEMAVENGEEEAMKWINQEVKAYA